MDVMHEQRRRNATCSFRYFPLALTQLPIQLFLYAVIAIAQSIFIASSMLVLLQFRVGLSFHWPLYHSHNASPCLEGLQTLEGEVLRQRVPVPLHPTSAEGVYHHRASW